MAEPTPTIDPTASGYFGASSTPYGISDLGFKPLSGEPQVGEVRGLDGVDYEWTGVGWKLAGSGSTPSAGGGGGGSASSRNQYRELFYQWVGRYPTAAEADRLVRESWTETSIIKTALSAANTTEGPLLVQARDRIRQIAAPYYDGDPSTIPASLVDSLIANGTYADETYLRDTYFPKLRGAGATNPLAQPYIDAWVQLTGRAPGEAAMTQLDQLVRVYGFSGVSEQAWLSWVKTTESAITGNFGAEQRAGISQLIASVLGRMPTESEIAPGSDLWDMNEAARIEAIRGTAEYESIYGGKPAWMSEGDWIAQAQAMDAVMRWYYGDEVQRNPDGSITIGMVDVPVPEPTETEEEPPTAPPAEAPETVISGITVEGGLIPGSDVVAPPVPQVMPEVTGLTNFGIDYITSEMLSALLDGGYTAEQLQREFGYMESVEEYAGRYDELISEAFGDAFTQEQWYSLVSGAAGSGALKAQLQEAQNRVGYREAYRLVFGTDPDPGDYDRILEEYISPDELLREYQARFSVDEMYDEVNDLLMRVYGDGVSKDELLGMVLKREGAGELKALINAATKLDEFTLYHKQYYGDPTPEDYAKYAGYVSPQELQWEIVATEAVAENMPDIAEAWGVAFPDEPMLTEEELFGMYAGKEGYGELRWKVKEAQEKFAEAEAAEDWAFRGAERADIAYSPAPGGGFKQTYSGLQDL